MTRLLLVAIFGIVLSPAITGQVIKPSSTTNPVCSTLGDIYYNTTTNHSRVCTAKAVGMTPDVWTVISGEINAETYGAKCDGTSDDTAAINSALGLGLPVRLPNGTCQSKGIVPASNSSLLCYGECIVRYLAPAAQRSLVYAGTTATSIQNFSVRGITFDENAVVPTGGGRNAIIDVENGYNVFIDHCVFKSSGTPIDNIGAAYFYNTFGSFTGNSVESTVHGLHVYVNAVSSQNQVIVAGNQLAGSFYNSIYVYNNHEGPNYAKITNNHIRDVTDPFGGNGQTGNCIVVYQSDYTLIDGNSCYNADFSGVRVSSSRSVIVSGNTVDRAAETSMYAELGSEGVIFTHNIITNCAGGITMTNVNMRAYGASTSLPALSLKNVAIANTVWGCSDYGIQTENDDVIDNKIVDVAYGIVIGNGGTGHDIVVRGNSLNNTGGIFTLGPINSGTSTCTSSSIAFSSSGSLCAAPPAGEYFANTAGVVIGTDLSNAGSGCIHAEFLTATFPCSRHLVFLHASIT